MLVCNLTVHRYFQRLRLWTLKSSFGGAALRFAALRFAACTRFSQLAFHILAQSSAFCIFAFSIGAVAKACSVASCRRLGIQQLRRGHFSVFRRFVQPPQHFAASVQSHLPVHLCSFGAVT